MNRYFASHIETECRHVFLQNLCSAKRPVNSRTDSPDPTSSKHQSQDKTVSRAEAHAVHIGNGLQNLPDTQLFIYNTLKGGPRGGPTGQLPGAALERGRHHSEIPPYRETLLPNNTVKITINMKIVINILKIV